MGYSDYCDVAYLYNETFPKARKEFRCVECGEKILKGETHLSYSGKTADGFFHGRQHMECRELCMHIRDHLNHGECLCFGELFDFWMDAGINTVPDVILTEKEKKARSLMAKIKWANRSRRKQCKK